MERNRNCNYGPCIILCKQANNVTSDLREAIEMETDM